MATLIIDAADAIVGRVAAYAAKQTMLGNTVKVINSEKAVVSGAKRYVIEEAVRQNQMGVARKGPFHYKLPDRHLRRVIRGMLPYKTPRGRVAYKSVLCYIGTPVEYQGQPSMRVPGADASKLPNLKRVTVGRICEELGGKHYG
jgi:large subunit ribosomal protein L13